VRFANLNGRACIIAGDGAIDVETASHGAFSSNPALVFQQWEAFCDRVEGFTDSEAHPFDLEELGPPSPFPRQVFALALNYAPHAAEAGYTPPTDPLVFTKFPSCLSGPLSSVALPGQTVDWEVEVVAVIGRLASCVNEGSAWEYVAGLTGGQDLSERTVQMKGAPAQFSLGKSFAGFGPTGPFLVSPDEFVDRDDFAISCALNGEVMQEGRTSGMIFSIPAMIAKISAICELLPGDLIFTGTPSGVGHRRDPPRYLRPGDELESRFESIGELRQRFVS